jgi:N-acetylglucosamine-6-sulfatase
MMRAAAAILIWLCFAASAAAQPNIVVIMTDDDSVAGYECDGCQPKVKELLAAHGVTFTNAYAATASCCPDRASFLTGLYSHTHGVKTNQSPDGGYSAYAANGYEHNNLFKWLKGAGYKTALFGKYLNNYNKTGSKPPFIDNFQAFINGQAYYDHDINVNGLTVFHLDRSPASYSTDWLGNRAAKYIANNAADPTPFFMLYTPVGPHVVGGSGGTAYPVPAPRHASTGVAAFVAPPTYANGCTTPSNCYNASQAATLWRQRLRSMLSVDDKVESIVDALDAAGKLDNTVIIYTTDNGFCIGEHAVFGKGYAWECSTKVYMLMRGPGIPQGETRNHLVSFVDLASTICELAGCTPELAQEGTSLMPIIADPQAQWRSALLTEWLPNDTKAYHAVRSGTLKYYKSASSCTEALYDLAADPWETSSKVTDAAYAARLAEMRAHFAALENCAGAECIK